MKDLKAKTPFFQARLLVCLPHSFQQMEQDSIDRMYPYDDKPQVILEEKGRFRFCTFSLLKEQGLADFQVEYVIRAISNMVVSLYPSCLLSEAELVKRKKGACGWFSFRTSGTGGMLYHVMYVFPVDGSMLLGTMGCLIEDEEGKEQMITMMESLENPETRSAYERISSPPYNRTS